MMWRLPFFLLSSLPSTCDPRVNLVREVRTDRGNSKWVATKRCRQKKRLKNLHQSDRSHPSQQRSIYQYVKIKTGYSRVHSGSLLVGQYNSCLGEVGLSGWVGGLMHGATLETQRLPLLRVYNFWPLSTTEHSRCNVESSQKFANFCFFCVYDDKDLFSSGGAPTYKREKGANAFSLSLKRALQNSNRKK